MSEVSVGRLLRSMGLTPQRPLRRAWQQDEMRVERWLKECSTIQQEARQMISAITANETMRFMTVKGNLTTDRFIEFLERLIKNQEKPVFLIVDGHPVHRSPLVKRFVEETQGN